MLLKLKYAIAESVKRNPWTWHVVWNALPRIPLLLPHDKSYYGFAHLTGSVDGLFLDVGANNGITAAGFRKLNRRYRILALEASRIHAPALERLKQKMEGFDYRITGVGKAGGSFRLFTPIFRGIPIHTHASASRGYMDVALRRDFPARVVDRVTVDEQTVEIIPIDSLDLSPSLVKIDIEGGDFDAVLGMQKTIARCRPPSCLSSRPERARAWPRSFTRGYIGCSFSMKDGTASLPSTLIAKRRSGSFLGCRSTSSRFRASEPSR